MKKGILGLIIAALLMTGCASNIKEGVEFLEEGRYEDAIKVFQEDIEEGKHLGEANRGIAIACYELGNYKEAVEYFKEALANETEETASIYHLMGTCCMQYEDYENALSYFEKALLMEDCTEEMSREMLFNKVVAYEKMMDWKSAKIALESYLQLYSEDEMAIKELEFLETR